MDLSEVLVEMLPRQEVASIDSVWVRWTCSEVVSQL